MAHGAQTRPLHPLEHPHPSLPRAPRRPPLHLRSGAAAKRLQQQPRERKVIYIHVAALPAVTVLSAMHEYYLNTEFVVTILPREARDLLWDGALPPAVRQEGFPFPVSLEAASPAR